MCSLNKKITVLESIDSTNNYAMALIRNGLAEDGDSVFAHRQTSGKGRKGNRFYSEPGNNIVLSVITRMTDVPISKQPILSMISALSVAEMIRANTDLKVFVKWPNDVFINDKKAAGILIENVIKGTCWGWAVTGFGININQSAFPAKIRGTSLMMETGRTFNPLEKAEELRKIFLHKVRELKSGNTETWLKKYNQLLYRKDEPVKLQSGNRIFEATIKEVTSCGKLVTEDVFTREWALDEVRMRLDL